MGALNPRVYTNVLLNSRQFHPIVRLSMLEHPPLTQLQRFVLDCLDEPELAGIEEHLLICERCRQAVSELDAFALLIRRRAHHSLFVAYEHMTEGGPLRLELKSESRGARFTARIEGRQLEAMAAFPSVDEAIARLRRWFEELYPEHLCTAECGGAPTATAGRREQTPRCKSSRQ